MFAASSYLPSARTRSRLQVNDRHIPASATGKVKSSSVASRDPAPRTACPGRGCRLGCGWYVNICDVTAPNFHNNFQVCTCRDAGCAKSHSGWPCRAVWSDTGLFEPGAVATVLHRSASYPRASCTHRGRFISAFGRPPASDTSLRVPTHPRIVGGCHPRQHNPRTAREGHLSKCCGSHNRGRDGSGTHQIALRFPRDRGSPPRWY